MEFHPEEEVEEEEGEMALPISSKYGDAQMINHDHNIVPLSPPHLHHHRHHQPPPPPSATSMAVVVRYKECLKNHAAAMGGKATDGCGEFMASGEEGTLEALTCSVCNCHRNFHRKEIDDGHHHHHHHRIPTTSYDCNNYLTATPHLKRLELGNGRNTIHPKGFLGTESFGYNHNNNNNAGALVPSIKGPPSMIMSYNMPMGSFPSESDDQEDGHGGGGGGAATSGFMSRHPLIATPAPPLHSVVKKRFRTKFTQEQKEKMLSFAEKVGWKMQKQEEAMIQDFCQEIGIKRRVLKVWMHNNKQNLAKNTCTNSISINPPQDPN